MTMRRFSQCALQVPAFAEPVGDAFWIEAKSPRPFVQGVCLAFPCHILRVVMSRISRHTLTLGSVLHVLRLRAKDEMRRVAADRIVAGVPNTHSGWNLTVRKFKRNAMSARDLSSPRHHPVAITVPRNADPRPARIDRTALNLVPEQSGMISLCVHGDDVVAWKKLSTGCGVSAPA